MGIFFWTKVITDLFLPVSLDKVKLETEGYYSREEHQVHSSRLFMV